MVDDDGMVDDEIDRNERIDLVGVAAKLDHRVAHRGEIDDRRDAGEVLHQHARRTEGDFVLFLAAVVEPGRDRLDVFLLDGAAVLVAQQVLQHDLQRERQLRDAGEAVLFGRLEREILVALGPDLERLATFEAVKAGHAGDSENAGRGKDAPAYR